MFKSWIKLKRGVHDMLTLFSLPSRCRQSRVNVLRLIAEDINRCRLLIKTGHASGQAPVNGVI